MKKRLLISIISLSTLSIINANNVTIDTDPVLVEANKTSDFVYIKFDISWENSWRTSSGSSNWDAVWIFVKYSRESDPTTWMMLPAKLSTSAADYSITNANGTSATFAPSADGLGVFVYRSADGTGNINWDGVKIRWNYGSGDYPVADDANVTFKVFAIEMVYIPTGSFYAGDGGTGYSQFTTTQITTANATAAGGYPTGCGAGCTLTAPTSSSYPNGYNAFYTMKYEVSQQQYCDFLNTLNYDRQAYRVNCGNGAACSGFLRHPNAAVGMRAFINAFDDHVGVAIKIRTSGTASSTPAVYGVDFANRLNENWGSSNGGDLPFNYGTIRDWYAYADWAGLRPMTELEYEKSARGPGLPVLNELAWGLANNSTNLYDAGYGSSGTMQPLNPGAANEVPNSPSGTKGNAAYYMTMHRNLEGDWPTFSIVRPLRSGAFATSSTTRTTSGASFYGVMDLSGNVSEMTMSIFNWFGFVNQGGDFTTSMNGDGIINDGMDGAGYFGFTGFGGCDLISFRGGNYFSASQHLNISHRYGGGAFSPAENWAPTTTSSSGCDISNRYRGLVGFRCVRTAP